MNTEAETILAQLGGRAFVLMTGARDIVGGDRCLTFRLPRGFAKSGIDRVEIVLGVDDTYMIHFQRWDRRRLKPVLIAVKPGVYCDQLAAIFREVTGLETRMPKITRLPSVVRPQ
jgi:hypothetical protein